MKQDIITILDDISDYCSNCKARENCHEEECILYRIESILNKVDDQKELSQED